MHNTSSSALCSCILIIVVVGTSQRAQCKHPNVAPLRIAGVVPDLVTTRGRLGIGVGRGVARSEPVAVCGTVSANSFKRNSASLLSEMKWS